MISYAVVDRIESGYAVLELEMIPYTESKPDDFEKPTEMVDVEVEWIERNIMEKIEESDVLIVFHEGKNITFTVMKSHLEKEARIQFLKELMQKNP